MEAKDFSSAVCALCDEPHPATGFCVDCNQYMCARLATGHARSNVSKNHRMIFPSASQSSSLNVAPPSPRSKSPVRDQEPRAALQELRERAQKLIPKTKEALKEVEEMKVLLNTLHDAELNKLKTGFAQLKSSLNAREEKLAQELESQLQQQMKLLELQHRDLTVWQSSVQQADKRAQDALGAEGDVDFEEVRQTFKSALGLKDNFCLHPLAEAGYEFEIGPVSMPGAVVDRSANAATSSVSLTQMGQREAPAQLTIVTRDAQHQPRRKGGCKFTIEGGTGATIEDKHDGTYVVSCLINEDCRISVKLAGKHLQGSPCQVLMSIKDEQIVQAWGTSGCEMGEFNHPFGITASTRGVFVADYRNNRIQVFDTKGAFLRSFGHWGHQAGQFYNPIAVAATNTGEVYVADYYNHRVQMFYYDGTHVKTWGSKGSAPGQFNCPHGVAIAANGDVYVADQLNHRIQVFREGTFLRMWGALGEEQGMFNNPSSVCVYDNKVWVTDQTNHRVQVFTPEGNFLRTFGKSGRDNGRFLIPNSIAVSPRGEVYVCDSSNDRVQIFHKDGRFLRLLGNPKDEDSRLNGCSGVAVAPNGDVFVADSNNDRIVTFK